MFAKNLPQPLLHTPNLENNTNDRNHDAVCNTVDCIFKPISRCSICSKYYCYLHANKHTHSMDNFEILK